MPATTPDKQSVDKSGDHELSAAFQNRFMFGPIKGHPRTPTLAETGTFLHWFSQGPQIELLLARLAGAGQNGHISEKDALLYESFYPSPPRPPSGACVFRQEKGRRCAAVCLEMQAIVQKAPFDWAATHI